MSKELQKLMDEVSEWQHKTFESVECVNIAEHLRLEAIELKEAIETDEDSVSPFKNTKLVGLEFADCLILLASCAKKYGFTSDELIELAFHKLEINKKRTWGKQNEDGTYTHIEP